MGRLRVVRRGVRHGEATSAESANRCPPAVRKRGRRAVPALRQHGASAHPPATARSAAELGAPGVSLPLREPWVCLGRHRPTEMVHPGLASPPRPLMRSTGNANWRSAAWPSAGRRSPTIASSPFVCLGSGSVRHRCRSNMHPARPAKTRGCHRPGDPPPAWDNSGSARRPRPPLAVGRRRSAVGDGQYSADAPTPDHPPCPRSRWIRSRQTALRFTARQLRH